MAEEIAKTKAHRIHIRTFGCQMNVYDSDRMGEHFKARGYQLVPDVESADVILLNTCAIRDKAEQKVRSLLGALRHLKESRPHLGIGVTGCIGQRMGRQLLKRVPYLDFVVGPDQVDHIAELVDEVMDTGNRLVKTEFDPWVRRYSQPAVLNQVRPSEFIAIMKGCDHFCSYCVVPFVRGREKSRSVAEVLVDVEGLVAKGAKEVVFLGQNINTYGKGTDETLAQLIEKTNKIEGLERIRYITSHPRDLGDDLIEQFGSVEKLCPQLHLPVQSGNNRILKRMCRLYTREEYVAKVKELRETCPDIALSTDIIVGFPGETEAEVEETLSLLREVRFASVYMFKYSQRPGTKAATFEDDISEGVKGERLTRVQELVNPIMEEENHTRLGKLEKVLVQNLDKSGRNYSGRTLHYRLVHILNGDPSCVGKVVDVEITETRISNMRGLKK